MSVDLGRISVIPVGPHTNLYRSDETEIIIKASAIVEEEKLIFPNGMVESEEDYQEIMNDCLSLGLVRDRGPLVAWALVKKGGLDQSEFPDDFGMSYLYTLGVKAGWQRQGYGEFLFREQLKFLRWLGYGLEYHSRRNSYPLLSNRDLIESCGYEIFSDNVVKDFYHEQYGGDIHEDAHHIVLKPHGAD